MTPVVLSESPKREYGHSALPALPSPLEVPSAREIAFALRANEPAVLHDLPAAAVLAAPEHDRFREAVGHANAERLEDVLHDAPGRGLRAETRRLIGHVEHADSLVTEVQADLARCLDGSASGERDVLGLPRREAEAMMNIDDECERGGHAERMRACNQLLGRADDHAFHRRRETGELLGPHVPVDLGHMLRIGKEWIGSTDILLRSRRTQRRSLPGNDVERLVKAPRCRTTRVRQGAPNQRFGAWLPLSRRRGPGVKVTAPAGRAADQRVDAGEEAATRCPVTEAVAELVLDHVPGLGGSGNRHNDVRESLSSQFGDTQVVAPESRRP